MRFRKLWLRNRRRTNVRRSPVARHRRWWAALRARVATIWAEVTWSLRVSVRYLVRSLPYALAAVVAMLIPVTVVYGYRYVTATPDFAVQKVQVRGAGRLSPEDVMRAAGVDDGPNLLSLDLAEVESRLTKDPWIRSARVERHLPDQLVISVTERKPAALIAMGALYLADRHGKVFKRVQPDEHFDLPVFTGLSKADLAGLSSARRAAMARQLIRGALGLVDAWSQTDFGRRQRISEVNMDELTGFRVVVGEGSAEGAGAIVYLGRGSLTEKLSRLETVMADATRRQRGVAEVRLDNEREPGRVAVRFRPGSTEPLENAGEEGRGS